MGKLKTYQTAGIARTGMGQLSEQPFRETELASDRVSTFLAQAQQTFTDKANVYAEEQAVKDAITSPITKEQIDQARQTGGNPISEFLKGGTTYNKAAQQVLGQQVAGELRLELDQISADVLEQVRTGEIQNQAQALEKLQEPISAHVEFLTGLDPKIAEGYGAQATASVRNYFSQADTIIRNQQEEKRYNNALVMQNNMLRDYQNYIIANPNATAQQKKDYKDTIAQMARDFSFSTTRKQEALAQDLDAMLTQVDRGTYAKSIADKYPNKTIDEIRGILPKDSSDAAKFYMGTEDKDAFLKDLKYELGLLAADRQGRNAQLTSDSNDARLYLNNGKELDPGLKNRILENADPETASGQKALALVQISDQIGEWNRTDYPDLAAEYATLDRKMKDNTYNPSITELTTYNTMGEYMQNLSGSLSEDYTKAALQREGKLQNFTFTDQVSLKEQADDRIKNLAGTANKYGATEDKVMKNLLTQQEADMFVASYQAADGNGRVALLSNIEYAFGRNSSKVIAQLSSKGLPFTAQLTSYLNNPNEAQKFLSIDDKEEQDVLKQFLKDNNRKFEDIRKDVYSDLGDFEEVIMRNYSFDSNKGRAKLDQITETLTYYAAQEMSIGKSKREAIKSATSLINNNFSVQETYHIPMIVNNNRLSESQVGAIINKAENIKQNIQKFGPVAYRSADPSVPDEELNKEMIRQMDEFGEWRNTPDGNGLVYGIVFQDGSFSPVVNNTGKTLSFEFDDTSSVIPHTETQLVETTNVDIGFGFTPSTSYYGDVQGAIDKFEAEKNMKRVDGTMKSTQGFLGPIQTETGVMTEFSVGIELDGSNIEIPTLVPTLTNSEIEILKQTKTANDIPDSIIDKAVKHAKKRIKQGKSPFYQDGE